MKATEPTDPVDPWPAEKVERVGDGIFGPPNVDLVGDGIFGRL